MIVCSDSNLEDSPPDGDCPGQDGKRPKYCNGGAKVAHQTHILKTAFESHGCNQMPDW